MKRLREQLKTARLQQEASAEVLRAIANSAGDAAGALQLIAETTARLFGAYSVSIRVAEKGQWAGVFHVGEGAQRIAAAVPATLLTVDADNMPGIVFRENRQIHVPDLEELDPAYAHWPGIKPALEAGTRVISGTPLRRGGEAVGVLIIHRKQLLPFTPEELALQQSFADQAVIAIENARLFNETKEVLERQTATAQVRKVVAGSVADAAPVFEKILDICKRLITCTDVAVLTIGADDLVHLGSTRGSYGTEVARNFRPIPIERSIIARAVEQRRTIHVPDAINGDDVPDVVHRMALKRKFNFSCLIAPMIWKERCAGAFFVVRTFDKHQATPFAPKDIALLETFADQAVIAIENARLFNETKELLQRQTATTDILKVIASSPADLQPVFSAIAERSNQLLNGHSAAVWRAIDDIMHLVAFTSTDPSGDEALRRLSPMQRNRFPALKVVLEVGGILEIADTEDIRVSLARDEKDRVREVARARGYRSQVFVPLFKDRQGIGFITVTRKAPGKFLPKHVQLLQNFADQAVIAIGNTELFNEVQQRTRELAKSLDDLRAAQDRLVQTEKLASLGQLTAGIAHEIKNPLNFVNNFAALSAELTDELNETLVPAQLDEKMRRDVDELTGTLRSNLEKVVQHGKRADSIVKNMLQHSRESSGERRSQDINALVSESLNLAYHGARAERSDFEITLEQDLDPNAGMAQVYPQELTRALLNLISNGFYAAIRRKTDTKGEAFEPMLIAATKVAGDAVEIRIRDNGTGITKEVREKIFNPFFTTKPTGEGTGLGLSMTHDIIVKQHGGRIDVETAPGEFTEFIVTLPRQRTVPA